MSPRPSQGSKPLSSHGSKPIRTIFDMMNKLLRESVSCSSQFNAGVTPALTRLCLAAGELRFRVRAGETGALTTLVTGTDSHCETKHYHLTLSILRSPNSVVYRDPLNAQSKMADLAILTTESNAPWPSAVLHRRSRRCSALGSLRPNGRHDHVYFAGVVHTLSMALYHSSAVFSPSN
jgi:hypothetical protein